MPRPSRRAFRFRNALFYSLRDYSEGLRGLPPPWVLRRAANLRKYSLPRFAITEPPLRPNVIAATDDLDWERRSSVRARAEASNSRHRAVRFSGSSGVEIGR